MHHRGKVYLPLIALRFDSLWQHAGLDARSYFQLRLRALCLGRRLLQLLHMPLELIGHGIEADGQMADLIALIHVQFFVQVAGGDLLHPCCQLTDGLCHPGSHDAAAVKREEQQRNQQQCLLACRRQEDLLHILFKAFHLRLHVAAGLLRWRHDYIGTDQHAEAPMQLVHRRIGQIVFLALYGHAHDIAFTSHHVSGRLGQRFLPGLPDIEIFRHSRQYPLLLRGKGDVALIVQRKADALDTSSHIHHLLMDILHTAADAYDTGKAIGIIVRHRTGDLQIAILAQINLGEAQCFFPLC